MRGCENEYEYDDDDYDEDEVAAVVAAIELFIVTYAIRHTVGFIRATCCVLPLISCE